MSYQQSDELGQTFDIFPGLRLALLDFYLSNKEDGKHQIINCRCLSSHSLDFSKHDPNPVNVSLVAAFWISLDESVKLF